MIQTKQHTESSWAALIERVAVRHPRLRQALESGSSWDESDGSVRHLPPPSLKGIAPRHAAVVESRELVRASPPAPPPPAAKPSASQAKQAPVDLFADPPKSDDDDEVDLFA